MCVRSYVHIFAFVFVLKRGEDFQHRDLLQLLPNVGLFYGGGSADLVDVVVIFIAADEEVCCCFSRKNIIQNEISVVIC